MKISPRALLEALARTRGERADVVLAFDGDGTLWSGDVGEDLFQQALQEGGLREHALSALLAEAARFELGVDFRDPNRVAEALFQSYLSGRYPERDCCGMMAWCYAGLSSRELAEHGQRVVEQTHVASRLTDELGPVLEWARSNAVRAVLISASPRAAVEAAGTLWGFTPENVAAATPRIADGLVLPELAAPVPYAEAKVSAARELFGDAPWLASFGDNVFDIEMLKAAELGVAVRPKPKLLARLSELELLSLGDMEEPL